MDEVKIIKLALGEPGMPQVDVSAIARKALDVPYCAQSPSQCLDIYLPDTGAGPFPTLIFLHGGAFFAGSKRDTQLLHVMDGIRHGYAVVSVEHRLAGEAQFPEPLFDLKTAIRFLRANAARYRLDASRFALCGDSSGAYFVLMAAATQDNPAFEDLSQGYAETHSRVQAVVSWFGCYDLLAMEDRMTVCAVGGKLIHSKTPPDVGKMLFGVSIGQIPGMMYFANPLHFITPAFPPLFIQHGTADGTVDISQAYLLRDRVEQVCGPGRVTLDVREGFDHGGFDRRFYTRGLQAPVFAFLNRCFDL